MCRRAETSPAQTLLVLVPPGVGTAFLCLSLIPLSALMKGFAKPLFFP